MPARKEVVALVAPNEEHTEKEIPSQEDDPASVCVGIGLCLVVYIFLFVLLAKVVEGLAGPGAVFDRTSWMGLSAVGLGMLFWPLPILALVAMTEAFGSQGKDRRVELIHLADAVKADSRAEAKAARTVGHAAQVERQAKLQALAERKAPVKAKAERLRKAMSGAAPAERTAKKSELDRLTTTLREIAKVEAVESQTGEIGDGGGLGPAFGLVFGYLVLLVPVLVAVRWGWGAGVFHGGACFGVSSVVVVLLGLPLAGFLIWLLMPATKARRVLHLKQVANLRKEEARALELGWAEAERAEAEAARIAWQEKVAAGRQAAAEKRAAERYQRSLEAHLQAVPLSIRENGGPARGPHDADDFEAVCAEFRRSAGFPDAKKTPKGPDGGVDVVSARSVGQAKFHSSQKVKAESIRALYGSRIERGMQFALFFAYGPGYTDDAMATARQLDVYCYKYNPTTQRFDRIR